MKLCAYSVYFKEIFVYFGSCVGQRGSDEIFACCRFVFHSLDIPEYAT